MNPALKKKLIMFVAMISFMAFFMIVFGSKKCGNCICNSACSIHEQDTEK